MFNRTRPFQHSAFGIQHSRPPQETEVRLNGADGLDWETLCPCDVLWLVEKAKLTGKRGSVSRVRRRQIVDKINAAMGWKLV